MLSRRDILFSSEILEGKWERDRRRDRGNDVRGMKIRETQKGRMKNVRD